MQYAIDDYPNLAKSSESYVEKIRVLFDELNKAIFEIDPCVTREFLKYYIAFKAETNFVDVVPQAKRLRLSLNMRFADVVDPKGICKDVTGIGRWGNGDVEVGVANLEELPYVMSLISQAFEKQMGT